jgi:hypothetical protein
VAVVVIGAIVGLVVGLSSRHDPSAGPTPSASDSPSPSDTPSNPESPTPTDSETSPDAAPSDPETDAAQPTAAAPATPSIDPAVQPYLKYCKVFYTDGPQIQAVSQNIIGFQPPADFSADDHAQVWRVVNKVTGTIGPVISLIDESLEAGPPTDMYNGLQNALIQFQSLYDAFAAVNPDTDPSYTGKLLSASQMPTLDMQNTLSAQVQQVGDATAAFCPPPEWLSQYQG